MNEYQIKFKRVCLVVFLFSISGIDWVNFQKIKDFGIKRFV